MVFRFLSVGLLLVAIGTVSAQRPAMDVYEKQVFHCFNALTVAAGGEPVAEWSAFEGKLVEADYLKGQSGQHFHDAWGHWLQGDGFEVPVKYQSKTLDQIDYREWEGCLIRQCRFPDVATAAGTLGKLCRYTDSLRTTPDKTFGQVTEGWLRIVTPEELEKSVYRWYLLGKWYQSANRLRLAMRFPSTAGTKAPDLVLGFGPGNTIIMDGAYVQAEAITAAINEKKKAAPEDTANFTVGLIVNEFTTEETLVQLKAAFDAAGGARVVYAK